ALWRCGRCWAFPQCRQRAPSAIPAHANPPAMRPLQPLPVGQRGRVPRRAGGADRVGAGRADRVHAGRCEVVGGLPEAAEGADDQEGPAHGEKTGTFEEPRMSYEQSVTRAVIAVVQEMGEATYEQVAERISTHPAERVRRALQNAKERGMLTVTRITKGERERRGLAVYAKAKEGPPPQPRRRFQSDLRRL